MTALLLFAALLYVLWAYVPAGNAMHDIVAKVVEMVREGLNK